MSIGPGPGSVGGWVGRNVLAEAPTPPVSPVVPGNVESDDDAGEAPSLEDIYAKLSPRHAAHLTRLLIRREVHSVQERSIDKEVGISGNTDSAGNYIGMMYQVPAGKQIMVTRVDMDLLNSATYNPSAPLSGSGVYAFLARSSPALYAAPFLGNIASLYSDWVAFAPTSSSGPVIPGQWTFSDSQGPLLIDGQAIFVVIVGGTTLENQSMTFNLRFREKAR